MDFGHTLFFGGIFLILVGALIMNYPHLMKWFGKLPGDIKIQNEKRSLFIPITSTIIVCALVTLGANLVSRLLTGR